MKFLLVLISCLLISSDIFAQAPVGRLADGRPYRVDEQGMRLSDYIAEIEVTNEELRQQVTGLEDEVAETNRKLNATGNSNCLANNTVKENNTACNYQSPTNPYYTKVKELEAELVSKPTQEQLSLLSKQSDISSLELSKLKSANDLQKEQLGNLKKQLQASLSDKEGLYQDLINKNRDAEENYSKVNNDNLELKQKISSLEKEMVTNNSLKNTLQGKNEEIAKLEKEIATNNSLKNLLEEKNDEIAKLKTAINSQNQRAALVYPETTKAVLASEPATDKTIVSYKSELRGQLQKIQNLILQRKNSLDNLKNRKSGILVSIQPLVASSGLSLDKIRLAVDNLSREEDVTDIKSGLSEISKILNEDLAVINRLLH